MKNKDIDIIERFQKFDFDPQERNQKQVFYKITAVSAAKKKTKRFAFAFAAVFSIIAAVIMVNDPSFKGVKSDYYSLSMDNSEIIQPTEVQDLYLEESKSVQSAQPVQKNAYQAKEEAQVKGAIALAPQTARPVEERAAFEYEKKARILAEEEPISAMLSEKEAKRLTKKESGMVYKIDEKRLAAEESAMLFQEKKAKEREERGRRAAELYE
ncbi:MAG: hypothetical protein LBL00_02720, partial [Endomicrobium sp.]|nr:hypothetical protein [Endomicrobium sp.]